MKQNDQLTERIIGCCFTVHKELGPGFPEKVYQSALEKALEIARISHTSGPSFEVVFRGTVVGSFRVDVLAEKKVVVEIKAVTGLLPKVFEAQVIAYLKATELPVGLLVNFGNQSCQVRRLVLSSPKSAVQSP